MLQVQVKLLEMVEVITFSGMRHCHLIMHGNWEADGLGVKLLDKEATGGSDGERVSAGLGQRSSGASDLAKVFRSLFCDLKEVLTCSVAGFLFRN